MAEAITLQRRAGAGVAQRRLRVAQGCALRLTGGVQHIAPTGAVLRAINLAELMRLRQRMQLGVGRVLRAAAHGNSRNTRKPTSGCAEPLSARLACTVQSDQ
ncbi:hypothetical protein OR60_11850 [Xanthomonas vesicatoria]|nr:hypothetical protein OR60_11850 [Xanthomonas vesicatoria]